jgi:predicted transcriptional regulator
MKPKKTASFTLRLDADLLAQIEQLAEQQHRNRTGIITEALRRYVETSTEGEP